ncbi:MAG: fibronectin type III domain-containing protein [Saprospiraceae bacterium]
MKFNSYSIITKNCPISTKSLVLKKKIPVLFFFFISTVFLLGQVSAQVKKGIKVSPYVQQGQVILRWIPSNFETWKLANIQGYHVERYTIEKNDVALSDADQYDSKVILENRLLVEPEANFESMALNNPMAGIAGAAIYSTDFNLNTSIVDTGWIKAKNRELENENRYNFCLYAADQSSEVARALALTLVDTDAKAEDKYMYIVEIYIDPSEGPIAIDKGVAIVSPAVLSELPEIANLYGEGGNKTAILRWDRDGAEKSYSSFIVQKAEHLAGPYSQIDGPNLVSMSSNASDPYMYFNDVLAQNNKSYFYRITGRSPFGILSSPSAPVEVIGKEPPLENAQVFITSITEPTPGVLRLTWTLPSNIVSQITGFDIYRSESVDGLFTKINSTRLSPSTVYFQDPTLVGSAYYKVVTIDANLYEISSSTVLGQLHDETPPAKPLHIKCSATKDGVATISWDKNTEEDLKGYRVFYSNDVNKGYAQITTSPAEENKFQYDIELNVLTDTMFYKVFALDYHENNSDYSDVCIMKRPDIIPPSPPVLYQALPTYAGVKLKWNKSSSRDVIRHELQRKISFDVSWDVLNNTGISDYSDIAVSRNFYYDYRVLAYDDDGNVSSSDILTVQPVYDGVTQAVGNAEVRTPLTLEKENVDIQKRFNSDKVTLNWTYHQGSTTEKFKIYRSGPHGNPRKLLAEFTANDAMFHYYYEDATVVRGKLYIYDVMLCVDGTGCQAYGEMQSILFRPKGGNKNATGGFSSTLHTNLTNRAIFPYSEALVHFDMGTEIGEDKNLEVYRSPLYSAPLLLNRLDNTQTKWFWQDKSVAAREDYLYDFKVCETNSNLCRWSEMETFVQFYPKNQFSVIQNYLPNYVQLQWAIDIIPPGAYYMVTKATSKNGSPVKRWKVSAPNVPNGDCRLPENDIEVELDGTYYYSLYFVAASGSSTTVAENIEVAY